MKIEVDGICKRYSAPNGQTIDALLPIDLSVAEGEFVCVVGPSGCGKSTMLNCVAGLVRPSSGQVLIDGVPITRPGRDRGMVFQEHGLFPWMTVGENVGFGPRLRGVGGHDRASVVDKYLRLVGLAEWGKRYPAELSGGMKQRVGIARALANAPDILLMDEPFASLDALSRDRMQEQLLNIWQAENVTCVFITHSIQEAIFLGDRIVVMSARPGAVKAIIPVNVKRRRDRAAPEFTDVYRTIEHLLSTEVVD